jgi:hypothetical protein
MATERLHPTVSDQASCGAALAATAGRLIAMFDLRGCRFEPFPFDSQLPRIETGRIVLPEAEPGLEPWSLDAGVELPIRCRGLTVGRYVLLPRTRTAGVALSPRLRRDAIALAAELGDAVVARMEQSASR